MTPKFRVLLEKSLSPDRDRTRASRDTLARQVPMKSVSDALARRTSIEGFSPASERERERERARTERGRSDSIKGERTFRMIPMKKGSTSHPAR